MFRPTRAYFSFVLRRNRKQFFDTIEAQKQPYIDSIYRWVYRFDRAYSSAKTLATFCSSRVIGIRNLTLFSVFDL